MPKVNDLNALPTAGKRLIVVAEVGHGLHLRMFDLEGKMVLDSDAKRFTSTWVEYLQQLVPRLWPPHELTMIDRISVTNAVATLAHRTFGEEMRRVHGRIGSLVGELRAVYPDDPRVARYLPERWDSLIRFGQGGVVYPEIREVLETTKDPKLRISALYFETGRRFQEPMDGRAAVSLAESFAGQAPGDKRSGQLLDFAAHKLAAEWSAIVGLAAVFALFAGLLAATIGMRRWLKYVVRVGLVLLAVFTVALAVWFFLANDTLIATLRYVSEKISDGSTVARSVGGWFGEEIFWQLRGLAGTIPAAVAVILAALWRCCWSSPAGGSSSRRRDGHPPSGWAS